MATTDDYLSLGWDVNILRGVSSGGISALPAGSTLDTLDAAQSLNDLIATPNDPSSFGSAEYNGNLRIGRDGNIFSNVNGWNDGVGFFLGWSDTTYKFFIGDSAGNKLTWDGSTLSVTGTITVIAGSIAGLTITATALTATAGGNTTIVSSGATAFTAGPTGAPTFTVTQAGALTATGVTISGAITATSGAIGGWVVTATAIKDAAGIVGMSSAVTGGDDIRFWAGHATPASAPFYVTEAGVLVATSATISGSITATSGTIGGFSIGADYIRDAANTFGLASTVTGGDDVRFWAGDTFANRATAPARITEAGNATFATITATGTINATAGYVGTATALAIEANGYNFGATGAIRGGATAYNTGTGWWLGYDTAAYKFFIGAAAGNKLTWDGTTLAITGTLTATLGTIGGFTIGATTLSAASGGNTTILSSGATAFSAGPTGSPTVTITQAGVFTGVGVNISNVTFNSIALTTSGAEILRGYNLFPNFDVDSQNGPSIPYPTAFSDATTKIMSFGVITFGTAHDANVLGYSVSGDVGSAFYLSLDSGRIANGAASTSSKIGCIVIGTDYWICDSGNNKIYKNGSEETISGTIQQGPLGHDPTNSYLLVLYSTTKIARFSGIAGATITNIASDITLDTAITSTVGFLYDNTNSRYICVDTTNNLLRRFNSAGATIDTVAYTVGDTYLNGLAIFNGRVHLVTSHSVDVDTRSCYGFVDIIPTSMLI